MTTKNENNNPSPNLALLLAKWSASVSNPQYHASEHENIVNQLQDFIRNYQAISLEQFYYQFFNRVINITFIPTSNAYRVLGSDITIHVRPCQESINKLLPWLGGQKESSYGMIKIPKDTEENDFIEFGTNEIAKIMSCC